MHLHVAGTDLPLQGVVGAQQQLLPGLAAGIESARDLHTTEGAVVQQYAVFASEREALCHALVDDLGTDLRQPPGVRFAGAVVPALDGVVEETAEAGAVVTVAPAGVAGARGSGRGRVR